MPKKLIANSPAPRGPDCRPTTANMTKTAHPIAPTATHRGRMRFDETPVRLTRVQDSKRLDTARYSLKRSSFHGSASLL